MRPTRADAGSASSFEALVRHHSGDLLRTAVLLTHDRGDAEDVVDTALATTYRHRRGTGDLYGYARRALVGAAAEERRRRPVQEIGDADEGAPLWGPSADDVVTRTLASLPARTRAVLVARYWADLSDATIAEALGCPVGGVEVEVERGLARLREQVAPAEDVGDLLRDNFAARADHVAPPPRDLLETTVAGHRRARRRRSAVMGAGLAAVLALGGVALGSGLLDTEQRRPSGPGAPVAQDLGIYEVPTRGSLAQDEAFVEGVRSIEWSAPMGWEGAWLEPEEGDRRVLFAGEVSGGERWALVMGRVGFQLLYLWFTGPADATGATLQPAAPPGRGGPEEPMTLMDQDRPAATLVVVGLPGDEVSFSPDGSSWEPVPTEDGVAVGLVTPPASLAEAELRITRAGGDVVHRSALSYLLPGGYVPPGAGPGPADDPDGRLYGERMRECLLVDGWVVSAAAGGAAIVASSEFGNPRRALEFQRDRQQCEVALGYRD